MGHMVNASLCLRHKFEALQSHIGNVKWLLSNITEKSLQFPLIHYRICYRGYYLAAHSIHLLILLVQIDLYVNARIYPMFQFSLLWLWIFGVWIVPKAMFLHIRNAYFSCDAFGNRIWITLSQWVLVIRRKHRTCSAQTSQQCQFVRISLELREKDIRSKSCLNWLNVIACSPHIPMPIWFAVRMHLRLSLSMFIVFLTRLHAFNSSASMRIIWIYDVVINVSFSYMLLRSFIVYVGLEAW